nr:4-oxalocrotonate decarboxylase [Micromonospora sp. DSM 115978]
MNIETLAARLDTAARNAVAIPQFAAEVGLDVATGYAVQDALVRTRCERGERVIGVKMGLTSRAKMIQVGVDEVIWGRLTDAMTIDDGGTVDHARFIHPRVEPEIAFLLGSDASVRAVAPAVELIDSRFADFSFSLPDVVADNTSAAAYAIGPWCAVPDGVENLGVLLEIDGRVAQTGSTAAILGDPRRALTEGIRLAGRYGTKLRDGWVFLAGAATAAVPLPPGAHVRAVVEKLGTVSFRSVPR